MAEIKVTTKLPLTSGKEATLTLEDGVVEIRTPVSFSLPKAKLGDLQAAVAELAGHQPMQIDAEPVDPWILNSDPRPGDETEDRNRCARPPARNGPAARGGRHHGSVGLMHGGVPPVWLVEEDGGGRTLCDLTGAELDLDAAEAACKRRGAEIIFRRPSAEEREERERIEGLLRSAGMPETIGISNDPEERIDLILQRQGGLFRLAHREVSLGESVKALREMLTEHDLLG